jgi:hypothetical protein
LFHLPTHTRRRLSEKCNQTTIPYQSFVLLGFLCESNHFMLKLGDLVNRMAIGAVTDDLGAADPIDSTPTLQGSI